MGAVIGGLLPLAVGVALSPTPVIAAILLASVERSRGAAVGFLIGWVAGIVAAVAVFSTLLVAIPDTDADAAKPLIGAAKIVVGLVMVGLAIVRWRMRAPRHADGTPAMPRLTAALHLVTPVRGIIVGFAMAAGTPKNMMMAASAGLVIGAGGLRVDGVIVAVAVFVVLASSTVWIPVAAYFSGRRLAEISVDSAREWLLRNAATVTGIVLVVIGVSQIGDGISLL